ncbi:hypothetical protein ACFL2V_18705 [Pseudomonadota bacterium]
MGAELLAGGDGEPDLELRVLLGKRMEDKPALLNTFLDDNGMTVANVEDATTVIERLDAQDYDAIVLSDKLAAGQHELFSGLGTDFVTPRLIQKLNEKGSRHKGIPVFVVAANDFNRQIYRNTPVEFICLTDKEWRSGDEKIAEHIAKRTAEYVGMKVRASSDLEAIASELLKSLSSMLEIEDITWTTPIHEAIVSLYDIYFFADDLRRAFDIRLFDNELKEVQNPRELLELFLREVDHGKFAYMQGFQPPESFYQTPVSEDSLEKLDMLLVSSSIEYVDKIRDEFRNKGYRAPDFTVTLTDAEAGITGKRYQAILLDPELPLGAAYESKGIDADKFENGIKVLDEIIENDKVMGHTTQVYILDTGFHGNPHHDDDICRYRTEHDNFHIVRNPDPTRVVDTVIRDLERKETPQSSTEERSTRPTRYQSHLSASEV